MRQWLRTEQWLFTFIIRSHQSLVYIVFLQVKHGLFGLFVRGGETKTITRTRIRLTMCVCVWWYMCPFATPVSQSFKTLKLLWLSLRFWRSFCPNVNFPSFDVGWKVLTLQNMTERFENLSSRGIKRHLRGYNYPKGANGVYSVLWRKQYSGPKNGWCLLLGAALLFSKAFIMEKRRITGVYTVSATACLYLPKQGLFIHIHARNKEVCSLPDCLFFLDNLRCALQSKDVFTWEQGGKSLF